MELAQILETVVVVVVIAEYCVALLRLLLPQAAAVAAVVTLMIVQQLGRQVHQAGLAAAVAVHQAVATETLQAAAVALS